MIFETDHSRAGHALKAVAHFPCSSSQLFGILSDPDSWNLSNPPRITSKVQNQKLIYSFDGTDRATVSLQNWHQQLCQLQISIEAHSPEAAYSLSEYWQQVVQAIKSRVGKPSFVVGSAPAKINIFFAVGSFLKDGYHEVASCYHALSLRESVLVELQGSFEIKLTGSVAKGSLSSVPSDKSNLVYRAAGLLASVAPAVKPDLVAFHIHKEVPIAGGMAGGSADAAAALVALNELFSANVSDSELMSLAAELGADVPFALTGGTAIGIGRGEELSSRESSVFHFAITPSPVGLSTPAVYKQLDIMRIKNGVDVAHLPQPGVPEDLLTALRLGDSASLAELMFNDLEIAALELRPELADIIQAGRRSGSLKSMVSGSGPTVIHLAKDRVHAELIANRLERLGYPSTVSYSSSTGSRLEG